VFGTAFLVPNIHITLQTIRLWGGPRFLIVLHSTDIKGLYSGRS